MGDFVKQSLLSAVGVTLCLWLAPLGVVYGFTYLRHSNAVQRPFRPFTVTRHVYAQSDSNSFLLDEFKLYNGEAIDPYNVLQVSRRAQRSEIRGKYITLSRRYHPDAVMHRDILPGSCNNLDDVRTQWERIKLAYEILSNKKLRKRYDRHEVIADPQAAIKRAAMDAAGSAAKGAAAGIGRGVFAVGKGLFNMGAKVVGESVTEKNNNNNNLRDTSEDTGNRKDVKGTDSSNDKKDEEINV